MGGSLVVTTYPYGKEDQLLKAVITGGATTTYTYDAANRQWQITDPESRLTTYVYDKDSRTSSINYPNNVKTTNTWNATSRLMKVNTAKVATGALVESFEYRYDKTGNRLSVKKADGSVASYEYDTLHRLKKLIEPGSIVTTYTYDAVGNLLSENAAPTYTYDEDDRLTKIDWGGPIYIAYTYDNNGNRKSEGSPSRGYSYFSYDYENRLASGYSWTHTYAPTGERVSSASASTTYYGQDSAAAGGLSDVVAEYNSTGIRQARYLHGPGADEPVEQLRGGSYYTYQKDGLGSVSRITDASQNSVNTYTYSPWGDTSGGGSLSNPFRYTGREADTGSQVYHYRARVYDPEARRFLTKDPAGMVDGTNGYAYAENNPINRGDPSGLDAQWLPIPCAVWFDWWGLLVKWLYFDWEVFSNTLLQFVLLYSVRGVNLWALYAYVHGWVFVTRFVCFPLIITAFATGAGWIAALSASWWLADSSIFGSVSPCTGLSLAVDQCALGRVTHMNLPAGGRPVGSGLLNPSRWDLQALLPTLIFVALFSTFMTLLFLGRLSDSRVAFAASLWVIAYSLATMLHRRFQAQRGRLSRHLFSLGGTESGRLLYIEYVDRRGIDLFLYFLLFATGSFSAVAWWPSVLFLSLAYWLTIYFDRKLVPIITSTHPADIFERLWLSLLVLQPVSNLPIVLQWWGDSGPSGMIFLAALFWALQLCVLASLLHLQWRVDKQADGPEGNVTKASGP